MRHCAVSEPGNVEFQHPRSTLAFSTTDQASTSPGKLLLNTSSKPPSTIRTLDLPAPADLPSPPSACTTMGPISSRTAATSMISFLFQLCTTAFALFLPAAPKSIYFNRSTKPIPSENNNVPADPTPPPVPLPTTDDKAIAKLTALELLWFHAKSAYSNFTVLRFSIWYAVASCIYYQTVLYVQVLWKTISNRATTDVIHWNGAVEAVLTISGAAITFFAGFVPAKLLHVPNALLGLSMISFMQGGVLLISGLTRNLWVAYGAHIGYCILHAFTITLLSSEIAKNICRDSFGLVFGINAMIGSVLQCLLTVVVVHCSTIKGQFVVYAGVCAGMGILYCVFLLVELKKWWKIVFYMIKTKLSPQKKIDLDGNKNHQII